MILRLFLLAVLMTIPACDKPAEPIQPDLAIPVPAFSLTERNGDTITRDDLQGKVWIASFVFTRCTSGCPQVTATMANLQAEFADEADIRLVTFTVDPERDDPESLREYARHFGAEPDRWLFLTGTEEEIHTLIREGFLVGVSRKEGDVQPGDEFDHSTKLVVVDQKGNIQGYFDGLPGTVSDAPEEEFEANLEGLRRLVRELLAE